MSNTAGVKLKQILIIEDDEGVRELLCQALQMRGFQVREAADGLAGLRQLEAYEPDLLIVDLGLPVATGFDVVEELRASAGTRMTPAVAISGYEDRIKEARQNPAFVAVLAKPFDPETLVRMVERILVRGPMVN